jgi:hypothetical protein
MWGPLPQHMALVNQLWKCALGHILPIHASLAIANERFTGYVGFASLHFLSRRKNSVAAQCMVNSR